MMRMEEDWRAIDRALRSIAKQRAALDAREAAWLRGAEDHQIWRNVGMVSALDYMERALGYTPRAAQDRLRVARALGDLSVMTLGIISFRRAVLHGEQGAILCDSWFHIRSPGLCRRATLRGFFRS